MNLTTLIKRSLFVALASAAVSASAQGFVNMDFETAGQNTVTSNAVWVTWNNAAPGWAHSGGGDSAFVYHNTPNANVGQYYFLADQNSMSWQPLAGNYSMVLVSGHYSPSDSTTPWINAWIAQQGQIPAGSSSFEMLATGNFGVTINSTAIPMMNVGGDHYVGDISQFAGQTVTLRIMNNSTQPQDPVILDNLAFEAQPVPEPSTVSLIAVGTVAAIAYSASRNGTNAPVQPRR